MNRLSWDDMFMEICQLISRRSTCIKYQMAAIIVDNKKNIISMGYNGVPSKSEHCNDYWKKKIPNNISIDMCLTMNTFRFEHREWSNQNEIHAEMNAITHLSYPLLGNMYIMYTLYSPCIQCSKLIIACKYINTVIFKYTHREYEPSFMLLDKSNIKLIKII